MFRLEVPECFYRYHGLEPDGFFHHCSFFSPFRHNCFSSLKSSFAFLLEILSGISITISFINCSCLSPHFCLSLKNFSLKHRS